jgi:hypothetical protein
VVTDGLDEVLELQRQLVALPRRLDLIDLEDRTEEVFPHGRRLREVEAIEIQVAVQ